MHTTDPFSKLLVANNIITDYIFPVEVTEHLIIASTVTYRPLFN